MPWDAVEGSAIGELAAQFDVIGGYAPSDTPTPDKPTLVSFAGAVSCASYYPGIAPRALVTIFGNGLSSTSRQWTGADIVNGKLPESLDGVSVLINDKPVAVSYVSPAQFTVTNGNGTSNAITVETKSLMPALFQLSREYVAGLRADGSQLAPDTAVAPGEKIVLYGTGFGPTNPEVPSGQVVDGLLVPANPVTLRASTTRRRW